MFRPDADLRDEEQRFHLVPEFAEPVSEVGLELFERGQAVGHRELAVEVDAQARLGDVGGWDAGLDARNFDRVGLVLGVLEGFIAVDVAARAIGGGRRSGCAP